MTSVAVPRRVLADAIPGGAVRDALLVAAGTGLIAASAQVVVPLPFTPVPLSLQTFAVLLTGAALGLRRGAASSLLYLVAGVAGVPWFSQHTAGWHFASFGYIIGFVLAGALVGRLAERRGDRTVTRTVGTMVLGNLAIYACGVPWLMAYAHVGFARALALGVVPFLVGDGLKVVLAAGLLPSAWRVIGKDA